MNISEQIKEELNFEKKLLEELMRKASNYPVQYLKYSVKKNGYLKFYTKDSEGKPKYIRRGDTACLRRIAYGKLLEQKIAIISHNIKVLERTLGKLRQYDDEPAINELPKAYSKAIDFLRINILRNSQEMSNRTKSIDRNETVIQSENPFHCDELIHQVSNGLLVRSKVEAAIAEFLIILGIEFRYEKALVLKKVHLRDDGSELIEEITRYPDFTIYLPDGKIVYWEHAGLMDIESYRQAHFEKISLYYDNGIYEPYNLIVTMDGNGKPYDGKAIRRIIETMILPFE